MEVEEPPSRVVEESELPEFSRVEEPCLTPVFEFSLEELPSRVFVGRDTDPEFSEPEEPGRVDVPGRKDDSGLLLLPVSGRVDDGGRVLDGGRNDSGGRELEGGRGVTPAGGRGDGLFGL